MEGEVEQDGASPSVRVEWALIVVGDFCRPWGWLTGKDCDCMSAAVEKLLLLSGCC